MFQFVTFRKAVKVGSEYIKLIKTNNYTDELENCFLLFEFITYRRNKAEKSISTDLHTHILGDNLKMEIEGNVMAVMKRSFIHFCSITAMLEIAEVGKSLVLT